MTQLQLDLYFDESGNFNPEDPNQDYTDSQIAGVCFPSGDREQLNLKAKNLLHTSYQKAYNTSKIPTFFHGRDIVNVTPQYQAFIQEVIKGIKQKQWQPIGLVNQEGISFGHPQDNYMNMIAELILKLWQQKQKENVDWLSLNIYPAYRDQVAGDYRRKIQNSLGIFQVREDLKNLPLTINQVIPISANNNYVLQVCDLLSNASYRDYKKCDEITQKKLIHALGDYNYTLIVPLFSQRCELLIQEGSYALALRLVILELQAEKNQTKAVEYREEIIQRLGSLPNGERNAQLSYLISWLEQTINQQRLLDKGCKLGDKLIQHVYDKLNILLAKNPESILWFKYAIHFWQLTAYNHLGNLTKARKTAQKLDSLKPNLLQQIEYISLFMEASVAKAVHYTDCFDYDLVDKELSFVESFYNLAVEECINILLDGKFKSYLRAKALGTWLQAKIYEYRQTIEPSLLEIARKLSDRSIEEFVTIEDKERQYQYRSQLENISGNFTVAREYLAKSLRLNTDATHSDIAHKIQQLDTIPQGFALLHWLRLGNKTYQSNPAEWQEFKQVLKKSKFLTDNPWCLAAENYRNYPVHGILRRVASLSLKQQNFDRAQLALTRLSELKPINKNVVLALVELAAYTEYIAIVSESNLSEAQEKIVFCQNLLQNLQEKSQDFKKLEAFVNNWSRAINHFNQQLDSSPTADKQAHQQELLNLVTKIGY